MLGSAVVHENNGQVSDNDGALWGRSWQVSDNDEIGIFYLGFILFLANLIIFGVVLMLGSATLSTTYLCCQSFSIWYDLFMFPII